MIIQRATNRTGLLPTVIVAAVTVVVVVVTAMAAAGAAAAVATAARLIGIHCARVYCSCYCMEKNTAVEQR